MGEIIKLNSSEYEIIMECRIFSYIAFNSENSTIKFFKRHLGIFSQSDIFNKYFKINELTMLEDSIIIGYLRKRFKIEDFKNEFNKIYSNKFTLNINDNKIKIERKENLLENIIKKDKIYLIITQNLINKYDNFIREYFKISTLITGDSIFEIDNRFIILECEKLKELDSNFKSKLKIEKYANYDEIFFVKENI